MAKRRPARVKKTSASMALMDLIAGKWVSQAISVAAQLGIADLLKNGGNSAADLARATGASEDAVYRLLRALASIGLFAESGSRKFRLTALGQRLRTDSPAALGGLRPVRWTREHVAAVGRAATQCAHR